ncbi:arginine--tRNA ligase [Bacillus sp. 2205SS5-2]|uniref:arginine--tRNA ligase n=1 Tax=Bacillus sp. 2205SS5-2 TaxID=3109031 RepID=UPI0030056F3B
MDFKKLICESLLPLLPEGIDEGTLHSLIETPKHAQQGDFSLPCFQFASSLRLSPTVIAETLAEKIDDPLYQKVENKGPYLNFFLSSHQLSQPIIQTILSQGIHYGSSSVGKGKVIALDMSSPNIAKPFSMGHLRSTVIGNSISLLAEKRGYKTVKINYIGDWGTQFGKLIVAFKKWGDSEKVKKNPISELFSLYTKFHDEAATQPDLVAEGRKAFKLLEDGDAEIIQLWQWFRNESLQAFQKIYALLGIEFDSYQGESYYNEKMGEFISLLQKKNLLHSSEGATIVPLETEGLPPCLIQKSDGATLYATRDLAAALDRYHMYEFSHALYIVGQEQRIHFQQVFSVLNQLGYSWATRLKHIPFGLYLMNGKKMSTRKGHVVLLEDMLKEAISLAKHNIMEKNPQLPNAESVAEAVGVGAVIYQDLKNERKNSVDFSMEDMLRFEGDTGPYLQYTFARAQSILRKSASGVGGFSGLSDEYSWALVKKLNLFPSIIHQSHDQSSPHYLAKYLFETAQTFNKYYGKVHILADDIERSSRLALLSSFTTVLAEGLRLLGIRAPESM